MVLMSFFVFFVGINHCRNKKDYKNECKNELSLGKHELFFRGNCIIDVIDLMDSKVSQWIFSFICLINNITFYGC